MSSYLADRKALEDITKRQIEALRMIENMETKEKFKEAQEKIFEASVGFLSNSTQILLGYFEKHGLYKSRRFRLVLKRLLIRDFNNAKKVLLAHAIEKPYKFEKKPQLTTFQKPIELE